jgi:FkbM family methyltransferase
VGAHHPQTFSNTYFFYKMGWRGINIDAAPGSMQLFEIERPRDINIEAAIATSRKRLRFYVFENPLLSSFDEELTRARMRNNRAVIAERDIQTRTLEEVLTEYLPMGQKIDFLSVDVEGLDLDVLKSNNWERFRPDYIVIECIDFHIDSAHTYEMHNFLLAQGYRLYAKTVLSLIYQEKTVFFHEDATSCPGKVQAEA